jgi:hypothetical protein
VQDKEDHVFSTETMPEVESTVAEKRNTTPAAATTASAQ